MKFVVITHVEHSYKDGKIYGYGPYIKEMNLWLKYVDEVIIVAPVSEKAPINIDLAYEHENLKMVSIPAISLTSITESIRTFFLLPIIKWKIFNALRKADHIHLRCPGNIGLIGSICQILFPKKRKTAKYAGNWDPKAKQPLTYKFQKWILGNTFLTKNIQVLVYGDWPGMSKNIKSFFTATYPQSKAGNFDSRNFDAPFNFVFVGSLSSGKRPLYAVKIIEFLLQKGIDLTFDLFGEGVERSSLESYIRSNNLGKRIKLHGNQTAETVETAYKRSDFLILPSKSEGWPKAVAEAMFWGGIPIVPEISCVPWMLGDGKRGILIKMDLERDATTLISLLSSEGKLQDMSKNGQAWSQNYTLDSFEDEIAKLVTR